MRNDNVLLAGVRPDPGDGIKVRLFPDGHIEIALLTGNGHVSKELSLARIEDLEILGHTITRAIIRYKEIHPAGESYLTDVRRILSPQTETIETALINARP